MIDFLIAVGVIILAFNTAILFRSILVEVRYRRAVRRRVRYYASLDEAIDDQQR